MQITTRSRKRESNSEQRGYGSINPKRMIYIEQLDDLERLLEAGDQTHAGAINNVQEEENQERQNTEADMELDHILDEWDDHTLQWHRKRRPGSQSTRHWARK